jgi:hypothetical protein
MTATATMPDSKTTWNAQFAALKARYPHTREAILMALHILLQNPDIALDDAKAQAALHGTRITAASINAARTLLSRMDTAPATKSPAPPAPTRETRRARVKEIPFDTEALVRGVVAKLQGQGNAEADRLREALRKAIAVLQAAVG